MNRKLVIFILFLFAVVDTHADEDPYITSLRAASGFSSLPGKAGPLKKGLDFRSEDYPMALTGFAQVSSELVSSFTDLGLLRVVRLARGSEVLEITIGVTHTATDNAHELLLFNEFTATQMSFVDRFKRGDPGIAVGDFNFISAGSTASNFGGYIAFVRNNVLCVISDDSASGPSTVDLISLAANIDSRIQSLPDLTPIQFDSLRPLISVFSPTLGTLSAGLGTVTTLNVSVSDPVGETLVRQFSSKGGFVIEDTNTSITVHPTYVLGMVPIQLIVINASLQFSTASTAIDVIP
jgi:hypothetical protein